LPGAPARAARFCKLWFALSYGSRKLLGARPVFTRVHLMVGRQRWTLFWASFLMLYFELAVIRWIPGQVRVLAYFTNFVLIACFFGMGLGLLLSKSRFDLGRWAPAGVAAVVALASAFRLVWVGTEGEVIIYTEYEGAARRLMALHTVLIIFYVAIAAAFTPFGQLIGRGFDGQPPLAAYSINLLGSVAGIVAFFVYSWLALPAWAWFLLGMPLLALLAPAAWRPRAAALASAAFVVALVAYVDRGTIWSPYQKIDVGPLTVDRQTGHVMPFLHQAEHVEQLPPEVGFHLRVNDDFYQGAVDLSDQSVARFPGLKRFQLQYELPYRLKPNAERVLIVGGGTGNDAAAALRQGARHVDVVEIDPVIADLGRRHHPEKPYGDPRVSVHVDDARHFFHHAPPGYDVVVFALLDSHRLMSTMSSLRLDSYVFTVEAFQEARRLLKPDGIQVTAFAGGQPWIESRFYEMLRKAYDAEPIHANEHGLPVPSGQVFISAPPGHNLGQELGLAPRSRPVDAQAVLPTDDWPFVYAQGRSIPSEYLMALGMVLALSYVVLRRATGWSQWPNVHFFCLGAAFMLLETKNITTIALVFGSTWQVNSVVFLSVLVMALLANLLVAWRGRFPIGWAYAGLFAAIALNVWLPLRELAGESLAVRLVAVGGVTALPLFFSGIVFAHSFRRAADPAHALGSNILGGLFGGVVEYLSMVMGLRFLFALVAGFYALSLLTLRTNRGIPAPSAAGSQAALGAPAQNAVLAGQSN
jgi:SAM-dependent methyltransferase